MINKEKKFIYSLSKKLASIDVQGIVAILYSVLTFLAGWAVAQGDTTLAGGVGGRIIPQIAYAIVILCLILNINRFNINLFILLPLSYWLITTIDSYQPARLSNILIIFELVVFCLFESETKIRIFKYYRIILIFMSVLGIICYISYNINGPIPFSYEPYYYNSEFGSRYADYKMSYILTGTNQSRLCGLFNEPGYFGTVLALMLAANGFNFRNKGNIVMLLAGCLTLSLAFFLILFIGLLLTTVKRPKLIIVILISVLFIFVIVPSTPLYEMGFGKFTERFIDFFNSSGSVDERSTAILDSVYNEVIRGSNSFFGYGKGFSKLIAGGNFATYKSFIIDYGLIGGFFLLFCPIFLVLFQANNIYYIHILCICVFSSLIQRPDIYSLPYFVIIIGGYYFVTSYYRKALKK